MTTNGLDCLTACPRCEETVTADGALCENCESELIDEIQIFPKVREISPAENYLYNDEHSEEL